MVRINLKVVAGGVALYAASAAGGYMWLRSRRDPSAGTGSGGAVARATPAVDTPAHSSAATFDALAGSYDSEISMDETVMGVPLLRRFLLRNAHGRVLEVSAGTGRNTKYYGIVAGDGGGSSDGGDGASGDRAVAAGGGGDAVTDGPVTSVVLADQSPAMVRTARDKWLGKTSAGAVDAGSGGDDAKRGRSGRMAFRVLDAERLRVRSKSFDTVVDTFGLCSCGDPEKVLREMQRVCKPGGTVLLLEHGKASYDWLNRLLDRHAPEHARKWGCWWNRDLAAVIAASGLRVESMRRFHFGTTYYVVARPVEDVHGGGEDGDYGGHEDVGDEAEAAAGPDLAAPPAELPAAVATSRRRRLRS